MEENENKLEFECDCCGKVIPRGKAYVCISKNIEQIDHNIVTNEDMVEIIDSNILLTFCGKCGNKFSEETFVNLIRGTSLFGNANNN